MAQRGVNMTRIKVPFLNGKDTRYIRKLDYRQMAYDKNIYIYTRTDVKVRFTLDF